MPEYAATFQINGLIVTGLDFPERIEIDKDFIFEKSKKAPGSAIAALRFETEEKGGMFSKEYMDAKNRLERFICLYSVFAGFSAEIVTLGTSQIEKGVELDLSKIKILIGEMTVKYASEEQKREHEKQAHNLIKTSVSEFQKYEKLIDQNRYLTNALNYFYYADSADRIEEEVINLAIALEALYLTSGMELSYRLSLRVASLLGKEYADKTKAQIAREIRDFYNKRSRIVHGETADINQEEVSTIRDYTRKSLQKFLDLSTKYNRSQILDSIDDALFD